MKETYMLYTDKLTEEYRAVFDRVEIYISTQSIDGVSVEERLNELLDIFLSAQSAGKSVDKVVGNDLEAFCKAFCSDYTLKNRILNILDILKVLAQAMLIISALDIFSIIWDLADGTAVDFYSYVSSLNVSGYFMGILIAMVFAFASDFIVRRIMFKYKKVSMNALRVISCLTAVIVFVLMMIFFFSDSTNFFNCPVWVILVCATVYLAVYYIFNYKRVKYQRINKIRFRDMVSAEFRDVFPDEMEKKYARANKRSIKKGNGDLPIEAFLEKEEKDCNITEKLKLLYYITPIVITAMGFIEIEFESFLDAVFYITIMLAVEYCIMLGLWKVFKKGVDERRAWIKSKREELSSNSEADNCAE